MPDTVAQAGGGGRAGGRRTGRPRESIRGRVKAHDPFELIRWLALSQPDPRKALAELVQNSLDAGAGRIRVVRIREHRAPCLKIRDDGEGVIPELDRPEALHYIATHIGHSRKRSLSPEERLKLMTQGQYGIGLLGFWSLGEVLEMRTSVPGQRPHRLILYRDRPQYLIEPLRGRLPLDERRTEVVVVGVHREALGVLGGRRAADYLASELRGQILARDVDLVVEDRMSRGRAQKIVPVRPKRFLGERVEGLGPIEVPGHGPIRLEVYLASGESEGREGGGIAVYSSGTLVAERFEDLASLGLDHEPWTDDRLTGLVDFPAFRVAPGSRRGVVPDAAAEAFARALRPLEAVLLSVLDASERRRAEELDQSIVRDLQRAFRNFYRESPRYAMLPVRPEAGATETPGPPPEEGAEAGAGEPAAPAAEEGTAATGAGEEDRPAPPGDLLPPGPLAEVRLTPSPVRVECRGARRLRAAALDASGRPVEDPVEFEWRIEGAVGALEAGEGKPGRILLRAGDQPAAGRVLVAARSAGLEASAEAAVEVLEEMPSRGADEGIPRPELVDEPGAAWRSRMTDGRWQVNTGHREYRAIQDRPALKLRYLALLFSKEVVLRSSQDPRLEKPLEQVVEVAAYADRNLAPKRGGRRRPAEPG